MLPVDLQSSGLGTPACMTTITGKSTRATAPLKYVVGVGGASFDSYLEKNIWLMAFHVCYEKNVGNLGVCIQLHLPRPLEHSAYVPLFPKTSPSTAEVQGEPGQDPLIVFLYILLGGWWGGVFFVWASGFWFPMFSSSCYLGPQVNCTSTPGSRSIVDLGPG